MLDLRHTTLERRQELIRQNEQQIQEAQLCRGNASSREQQRNRVGEPCLK
jgi:hypothetical protein